MEKKFKIGIVGCGGVSILIHLPILQQLSDLYQLEIVCDEDINRAAYCANRFNIKNFTDSLDQLLNYDIEIVVILSSNHEEIIEKCILANKHIFTEKPISLSYKHSLELCDKAYKAHLLLRVGLMRLYDLNLTHIIKNLRNKDIYSSIFVKFDGTDLKNRKKLLPKSFDPYTFNKFPPSVLPEDLTNNQIEILKKLLWDGIHLLTSIVMIHGEVTPLKTILNKNGTALSCLLKTKDDVNILYNISDTQAPVYNETIEIILNDVTCKVKFNSPYFLDDNTVISANHLRDNNKCPGYKKNPFKNMWISLYRDFKSAKYNGSLDKVLQVEKLALDISKNFEG